MTNSRPRRRWLRWFAVALMLGIASLAFAAWRFSQDRERVAALVVAEVRAATGLDLAVRDGATVGWFPLAIRLERVELRHAGRPLLAARALAASVPISVLWTGEPHISSLTIDGAIVDLDTVTAFAASRADDGPPAPLRWPRLDSELSVRNAELRTAGSDTIVLSFHIGRLAPGDRVELTAQAKHGSRTWNISVDGVPADARGLSLDPARIAIRSDAGKPIELAGKLRFAAARDWSTEGALTCAATPAWLAELVPGLAIDAPLALDVAANRSGAALAVRAKGKVAQSNIDADLAGVVPPEHDGLAGLLALAASPEWRGHASLDRWQVGDVVLEGIELREATEAAK